MLNTRTLHNSAEFLTPSSVKQSIVCVQELLPIKYYSCDQVSRNEIGVECGMEVHTGVYGHCATTNFIRNNFLQSIITIWWLCERILYAPF
jgi:hypothetical protein